jgi:hypothetical protein
LQSLGTALTHEYNAIAMEVLRADDMFEVVHSLLKKVHNTPSFALRPHSEAVHEDISRTLSATVLTLLQIVRRRT